MTKFKRNRILDIISAPFAYTASGIVTSMDGIDALIMRKKINLKRRFKQHLTGDYSKGI